MIIPHPDSASLDLAGLKLAYEKATPGVWSAKTDWRPEEWIASDAGGGDIVCCSPDEDAPHSNENWPGTMAFIVTAHENWLPLLSEIESLRAALAEAEARGFAKGLEQAAHECGEFEAVENDRAYDKRQAGRDDNFNCARASAATMLASQIRALKPLSSPNSDGDEV